MLKFNLTANSQHRDGFKLSVQADGKEERETAERLTGELINKIKTIEVKINNELDDEL